MLPPAVGRPLATDTAVTPGMARTRDESCSKKACLAPARMIGLPNKGHLGVGADADAALVDPARRFVRATFAGGRPIMLEGVVVGSGGTVATTARRERAIRAAGLPVEVVDLRRSALYRPAALAG